MRIHVSRSFIPNLFTVLNIFFGFVCVTHAFRGEFVLASVYVLLSALCDALDGFMARLTHSASEFGVELDSLADVVSFGMAPAVFVYFLFLHDLGGAGMFLAALPLIFGALRLARFNVQLVGFSKEYFSGMPIPLSALILTSFAYTIGPDEIIKSEMYRNLYTGLVIMCSILMISTIRYPVFPKFSKREFKSKPVQMTLYIIAGIVIAVTQGKGLFPVLFIIGISGPIAAAIRLMKKKPPRRQIRRKPRRQAQQEFIESEPAGGHASLDSN